MKKTTFFLATFLLLNSFHSFAQTTPSLRKQNNQLNEGRVAAATPTAIPRVDGVPVVMYGTIETPLTSRERILRHPRLIAMELGYEVKSFTFTINDGGKTWGPEKGKGPMLSEEMKDKIKESESPRVKITIDNIVLDHSGKEVSANAIVLEYDH